MDADYHLLLSPYQLSFIFEAIALPGIWGNNRGF